MTLETIPGNLLMYKQLESGTFQHVDQLTTERRTNIELRNEWFYTADGNVYTIQKGKSLWAITREPQNLVLQNIDEAYRQLTSQGNYFPDATVAQTSLDHTDTVVVDLKCLKLMKSDDQYGRFVIDPKEVKKLNSEQRKVAQRMYGPDEENFRLNMDMFARARKTPRVSVLLPEYVQSTLRNNGTKFLGRTSWLNDFDDNSDLGADERNVDNDLRLRGVRCEDVALNNEVPSAPQETETVRSPTMEEILTTSQPFIPELGWERFQAEIGKLYNQ